MSEGCSCSNIEQYQTTQVSSCCNKQNDQPTIEDEANIKFDSLLERMKYFKKTTYFLIGLFIFIIINLIIGFAAGWDILGIGYSFVSDQILGMKWLNNLMGMLVSSIGGQEFADGPWGKSIQFFLYDIIKIFVLLSTLIFISSYIQTYFPPARTKRILSKFRGVGANLIGALLGTVTPFCSCSSIPIFIGFTRANISSGVTFSFLISSPLVDIAAFVLLSSIFGFPVAIIYVVVGLILAVIGGTIIEKTKIGNQIADFVSKGDQVELDNTTYTRQSRIKYALTDVWETIKSVWIYILIGIIIGAAIHNWIPEQWITAAIGDDKWYSVFVATFIGVPIYADIFGTIPIAEALHATGVGIGTILAFMMSVTALSIPSLIMLKKVVKWKLLIAFMVIIIIGIILIGFMFNAIQPMF